MFSAINLLILGVSIFSYFAFTAPQDCPRKYRVLKEKGGELQNLGEVHRYCKLDYGLKFKLKKEYEKSDMEGKQQYRGGEK